MEIFLICLTSLTAVLSVVCLIFCAKISAQLRRKEQNKTEISEEFTKMRSELNGRLDSVQMNMSATINEGLNARSEAELGTLKVFAGQVRAMSESVDSRMSELRAGQNERLEAIRQTLERNLHQLSEDNQKKLEEIRGTVDEKLQKTLNDRVSESFKLVGSQLEQVHKSLGEMQTLANGVGDLKRILSNVKTRGVFGEVQLARILEQILTKEQYDVNVATKHGSRDVVEFAIKLPGKSDYDAPVYLPIDAKFPLDVYNALLDAYDTANNAAIEQAWKALESVIKKNAKDIRDKYIDPPNTTDFAVMFLPTEGLYAEVVRRPGLVETVARDYGINIAGPSTVSALLNSLQMGFRTLAIEKRSHEVWTLLGAVKTEFANFETVLNSVKKRFEMADSELNKLIGVRTRAVIRKLKQVESLPEAEAKAVLGAEYFEESVSESDSED